MASISREPGGRRTIQFVGADGKRRSLRLGKVSQRVAEAVKVRVEHLATALLTGHAVDDETARWVAGLDVTMTEKLAAVGLVPKREAATLGAFLEGYVTARADVKDSTGLFYGHTKRNLLDYFGQDKPLRAITPGDADAWRLWLVTHEHLADNTVRRRCGLARQFLRVAVRKGLLPSNPFDGLPANVRGNPDRFRFVTRDEAAAVLGACPDAQWRVLFALARFGGLRCPSETLRLRWPDVDWAANRIQVTSPKTEHHPGGGSRIIPLFPELLPYLREAFEEAEPGTEYVVTRYRDTTQNLGTQLRRIILRAGLEPWPKLWQNLRSTRETELAERYPMQVVCAWIGNSPAVAGKHYLQVTEDHFRRAIETQPEAVQNPVQQPAASGCRGSHKPDADPAETAFCGSLPGDAARCEIVLKGGMGVTGLEPVTLRV